MPSSSLIVLDRLDRAEQAGQHAEHAALGAGRNHAGRRRLRVEAAVAGPALRPEDGRLALEAEDRRDAFGLPSSTHASLTR
jgi:hypothetical protein